MKIGRRHFHRYNMGTVACGAYLACGNKIAGFNRSTLCVYSAINL